MKLYRVRDIHHQVRIATSDNGEDFFSLKGNVFYGEQIITNERIETLSILSPLDPVGIPAVYCVGLNYRKHAEETGAKIPKFPVIFMKASTAVQDPGLPIQLPRFLRSERVDIEAELAIVIGSICKNVKKEEALSYVLGYTAANDVSARDWQKDFGGSQWCRGKTFDTFCPLGPALVTPDEFNPDNLAISSRINGEEWQSGSTSDMIFSISEIISFLSGSTTLMPGTVILTGTPHGVGMARTPPVHLKPGDVVEVEIEGIGILKNPVTEEAA
ncbi:MAG: fumarylacetoacetate hydrolase family protein [Candidatus Methylacidiphilales bacterium]|nr:fumarylacetoacetate hydrolase family protein [Candidatus Methylacidiphilales bacterium]